MKYLNENIFLGSKNGSGIWVTIRYARKINTPVMIIWP